MRLSDRHPRPTDPAPLTPGSRPASAGGREHRVQFYDGEDFLASTVADYLGTGLTGGESLVVIASETRRWAFVRRLETKGFDVATATRGGQITLLDARDTLRTFMAGSMPDAERFRHTVGGLLDGARSRTGGRAPLRLYGEMVDLLCKDGNVAGAIRLEELWNDLSRRSPFSLLCAYSMGNFRTADDAHRFRDICGQHSHVVPTESYVGVSDDARLVQISILQQRAHALEAELENRRVLEHRLRESLVERERVEQALRTRESELQELLGDRERLLEGERTARAEAEAARLDAENATRAKSQFLAVMSHELRTPLNAIAGHVQLIAMGIHGAVTEAQLGALERVTRSQRHLLRLINEVLNLSRIETGRVEYTIEAVAVQDVVSELLPMVEPQLAANGIELEVCLPVERVGVSADREKLAQVLLNLLSNSAKFTPAGGHVRIDVATRAGVAETTFIRVSDTGIGIPREKHEAIFEPFVQVHSGPTRTSEGAGLGLAISRELARGMGGDLRVRSEGRGSTFTLSLRTAD